MARELGTKFTCFNCGTRFYDLRKPEPVCPKCGADQRDSGAKVSSLAERRRSRPPEPIAPEPEESEKDAADVEEGEAPEAEDEEEDDDEDEED